MILHQLNGFSAERREERKSRRLTVLMVLACGVALYLVQMWGPR